MSQPNHDLGSQHNVTETDSLIPAPKWISPLYDTDNLHAFTVVEDATLVHWKDPIQGIGGQFWNCALAIGNNRTAEQCKDRYEELHPEDPDHADGFSIEENNQLFRAFYAKSGSWTWIRDQLPHGRSMAAMKRQVKALNLKFSNLDLNGHHWTPAEDDKLRSLKETTALKWDEIEAEIPGRRERSCKDRWAILHPSFQQRVVYTLH